MSMNRFDEIKALAFDHYGTLFDKHAISELIEAEFPGHGLEVAQSWYHQGILLAQRHDGAAPDMGRPD